MLTMEIPSIPAVLNGEENIYESLPSHYSFHIHMFAGAFAGIVEHSIVYPVDSIKTRMQTPFPHPRAAYSTVLEGLLRMIREEGFRRPYRGLSVMLIGAIPAHAFYFSIYEQVKRYVSGTETGGQSPLAQAAAGSLATIAHDFWMNPAEVVKQRMQVYNSQYSRMVPCFISVWRNEGFKAFYRSFPTQICMNIPYHCSHFMAYEYFQEWLNPAREYSPLTHISSGAIAGAFASAITTPLDVCKTLINTQDPRTLKASKQEQIKGALQAIKTIYQCCGVKGYFRGLRPRIIISIPSTAILWLTYESIKASLKGSS